MVTITCWVDRWYPGTKHRKAQFEPVAADSPVGRLLEHPNVPSVEVRYDDGHSTTYWKEKPDA